MRTISARRLGLFDFDEALGEMHFAPVESFDFKRTQSGKPAEKQRGEKILVCGLDQANELFGRADFDFAVIRCQLLNPFKLVMVLRQVASPFGKQEQGAKDPAKNNSFIGKWSQWSGLAV